MELRHIEGNFRSSIKKRSKRRIYRCTEVKTNANMRKAMPQSDLREWNE